MKTTFASPAQRKSTKRALKKSPKTEPPTSLKAEPAEVKPWEEIRKDKVARAKKLLEDANYPSPEVIRSVAGLLARNWDKSKDS